MIVHCTKCRSLCASIHLCPNCDGHSVVIPKSLLTELIEVAETNTVDIKGQYIAGHGDRSRQSMIDMYDNELATIAKAKELLCKSE